MEDKRKKKCYNCKFSGKGFKIADLTHHVCEDPKRFTQEKFDNREFEAWDALVVYSDTCDNHEFKENIKPNQQ